MEVEVQVRDEDEDEMRRFRQNRDDTDSESEDEEEEPHWNRISLSKRVAEADAADDPHVQWIDDAGPSICRMKKVAGKAPAGRGGAVKYVDSWFVEAHPDFAKTVLTGEVGTLAQRLRPEEEPMLAPPLAWRRARVAGGMRRPERDQCSPARGASVHGGAPREVHVFHAS